MIEIYCVARLCRVVMMSYFLGNDATSVNAFYFVGTELVFLSQKLTSFCGWTFNHTNNLVFGV
jgi:hypothetical protein